MDAGKSFGTSKIEIINTEIFKTAFFKAVFYFF